MSILRALSNVALAFVVLLAFSAFAQDGGLVVPALADDPVRAVTGTAESIARGDWWPAAAGLVSLLTWLFRSGVLKNLPKEGPLKFLGRAGNWLYENPIAALATPLVLSGLLGFFTTFANGTPFTLSTVLQETLKIGAGAITAFIAVEKFKEAKNAGALAAAGITDQQKALDELAKQVIKGPLA